jgi:hypothetical protein
MIFQVAGEDVYGPARIVSGPKEWQAVDVIPVGMAEQQVNAADIFGDERLAQSPDPGSRIKHEAMIASRNLHARCVTAVFHIGFRAAGNAAANTPETNA